MDRDKFLKTVTKHKMDAQHELGIYRHLVFSDGTFNRRFELVTWPMHLSICGDMGTYVFCRCEDMFTFFRRSTLEINADYWSEKLESGVATQFSRARVVKWMREQRDTLKAYKRPARKAILEQMRYVVEGLDEHGESEVRRAIDGICDPDGDPVFYDMFDVSFSEYTSRFLWCLFAIVWGIGQYDVFCSLRVANDCTS